MSNLEIDRREWTVFTRLSRLESAGHTLGEAATAELHRLRAAHNDWESPADERSDFAVWSETHVGDRGNAEDLRGIPTNELLSTMREIVNSDRWHNDGLWRRFIASEPQRSFEALRDNALQGDWNAEEWRQLFYYLRENNDRPLQLAVTILLIEKDIGPIVEAGHAITGWFEARYLSLVEFADGAEQPLQLWDKLAELLISEDGKLHQEVRQDPTFAVLNEPPGELAEVLIHELNRRRLPAENGLPTDLEGRFETALHWPGDSGLVAQSAFLMQMPFLEYIAPRWVGENLAPMLLPSAPESLTRWRARFRANRIGTVSLFNSTKEGFLWTFDRVEDDWSTEGQVLLLLQAAYQKSIGGGIDLSPGEAKGALARAGSEAMATAARILRRKDETTSEEHWDAVVKPIFSMVWPADDTLQTERTTAALVDLSLGAGDAFPDAVTTIRPFLLPAWTGDHVWHYETDFDESGVLMLAKFPEAGLSLLDRLIPPDSGPSRLNELLDKIEASDTFLARDNRFRRLRGLAKRLAA